MAGNKEINKLGLTEVRASLCYLCKDGGNSCLQFDEGKRMVISSTDGKVICSSITPIDKCPARIDALSLRAFRRRRLFDPNEADNKTYGIYTVTLPECGLCADDIGSCIQNHGERVKSLVNGDVLTFGKPINRCSIRTRVVKEMQRRALRDANQ